MMATRVFVVEDHGIMREMLVEYLTAQADMEVCGDVRTGREALAGVGASGADVAIVDMRLPDMTGTELIEALRQNGTDVICIVLSGHTEDAYVRSALEAGAAGYVLKGNPSELPVAIRQVLEGERYLSPAFRTDGV